MTIISLSPEEADELEHYGILRKSGRYPWGSGENPYQRSLNFTGMIEKLREQGLSNVEIAKAMGFETTTALTQTISISNHEIRAEEAARAMYLRNQRNMSVSAVAREMGKNESSVRSLLNPDIASRQHVLKNTTDLLRDEVENKQYIDIGKGTNNHLGISTERLMTAVSILEDEGYKLYRVKVDRGGGRFTNTRVLGPKDSRFPDLIKDPSQIKLVGAYSQDNGATFEGLGLHVPSTSTEYKLSTVLRVEQRKMGSLS